MTQIICKKCERDIEADDEITLHIQDFYHSKCYRCYVCGERGEKELGDKVICNKCIKKKVNNVKKIENVGKDNTQGLIRKDTLDEY